MSKYIKSFKTKAEYNTYIAGEHATPYTAYVEEEDKYYYGAKEPEMLEFEIPANPSGAFTPDIMVTEINMPVGVTSFNRFNSCTNIKKVSIPSGVTAIPAYAFSGCSNLTSVSIPNTVTTIGDIAFMDCTSLTSVTIPSGVTSISNMCFSGCTSLTSVNIPSGVTSIADDAFKSCQLTSITIPSGVTTIGGGAFNGCSSLTSVTCLATTPPTLGLNVFKNNASGRKFYVPAESVETYKSASRWSSYASYIEAIPSA